MSFKLVIVGSGSAVPTLQRAVTSQYINFNERRILIDCGEGTQLHLRKFKVPFQRLQFIFISHLHGDHFLGIFGLLASMNLLGRTQKLIIFCPEDLEKLIQFQFELTGVSLDYEIEFRILSCKDKSLIFEDNLLEIYAFPVKHRIPCYGFLFAEKAKERNIDKDKITQYQISRSEIWSIKNGADIERDGKLIKHEELTLAPKKSIQYAFCTDTKYYAKIAEWVKDVDLLYHESTFTEKQRDRALATKHSTALDAGKIAKEARVKKLLLGHFSARFDSTEELKKEAMQVFENVECVQDGNEYNL